MPLVRGHIPFLRGTEIGRLAEGKDVQPIYFISCELYSELVRSAGKPEIGDLLLPSICPDGRVWMVSDERPFYIKDARVLWVRPKRAQVNSRYLRHSLSVELIRNYGKYASGGSFAELKINSLKAVKIQLPPLPVQQHVADILDRFDALTTSLTDGLPAEIKARRRQYEYYRDRLLDFPRKEA